MAEDRLLHGCCVAFQAGTCAMAFSVTRTGMIVTSNFSAALENDRLNFVPPDPDLLPPDEGKHSEKQPIGKSATSGCATLHNWVDGACSRCGAKKTEGPTAREALGKPYNAGTA
jgi:hypothetical protein